MSASPCSSGNIWDKLESYKLLKKRKTEFCKEKANLLPSSILKATSFLTTACTRIYEFGAHLSNLTCWALGGQWEGVWYQGMFSAPVFRA